MYPTGNRPPPLHGCRPPRGIQLYPHGDVTFVNGVPSCSAATHQPECRQPRLVTSTQTPQLQEFPADTPAKQCSESSPPISDTTRVSFPAASCGLRTPYVQQPHSIITVRSPARPETCTAATFIVSPVLIAVELLTTPEAPCPNCTNALTPQWQCSRSCQAAQCSSAWHCAMAPLGAALARS
jgi:hypothetical protein